MTSTARNYARSRKWLTNSLFSAIIIFSFWFVFSPGSISPSDLYPKIKIDKMGFISDIHAASQDIRTVSNSPDNVVYPSKYKEAVDMALKKMKNENVSLAVSLGDTTNNGSIKHAENIKQIAQQNQIDMLFVRGNHDRDDEEEDENEETPQIERQEQENEKKLSEVLNLSNRYYYVDREGWRIVVLDSNELSSASVVGGMSEEQLRWLEDVLKTDKWALIAMHHPVWNREDRNRLYEVYGRFYDIIKKSRNVRYVLSGHEHINEWEKEQDGIKFFGLPALTLKDNEGRYKTINLESYIYD